MFAIGTIAVAGIIGLYSFFNYHDAGEIAEKSNPVPVTGQISNNKAAAPSAAHKPTDTAAGAANMSKEPLSSKTDDFADMRQSPGEDLGERDNGSAPEDSAKSTDINDLKHLFQESVINTHTLGVAQMIQAKFSESLNENAGDLWFHYNQVEEFLRAQISDEANVAEFLNFYKKYTEYEMAKVSDPHSLWQQTPETPEEAMRLNNEKHQYQRDVFGREVADILWGEESAIAGYKMKALEILRTDIYSAPVKEQLINDLRKQTFGDDNGQQDTDYNYQLYLKLAIYSDELNKMTDEERENKIREFRNEIFPPDQLKFLEFLEGVVDTEPEETESSDLEWMY